MFCSRTMCHYFFYALLCEKVFVLFTINGISILKFIFKVHTEVNIKDVLDFSSFILLKVVMSDAVYFGFEG